MEARSDTSLRIKVTETRRQTYSRISLYSMLSSRFCRLGFALRIALM